MAAVLEPSGASALMRAIAAYEGQPLTRAALELSALLFQRPGNIRQMEWAELDLDRALWTIPAAKMKRTLHGKVNGRLHLMPLAKRTVAMLSGLKPLSGHSRYVFPSLLTGERCMSENTLRTALRRMGYTNDEIDAPWLSRNGANDPRRATQCQSGRDRGAVGPRQERAAGRHRSAAGSGPVFSRTRTSLSPRPRRPLPTTRRRADQPKGWRS
jgi:integrase